MPAYSGIGDWHRARDPTGSVEAPSKLGPLQIFGSYVFPVAYFCMPCALQALNHSLRLGSVQA